MKQKITVTKKQIFDAVKGLPSYIDGEFYFKGEDDDLHQFPDSIEVEVDVPEPERPVRYYRFYNNCRAAAEQLYPKMEAEADKVDVPQPEYKLMAPCFIDDQYPSSVRLSAELFDCEGGALSYYDSHPPSAVVWPATIDPATGMYKVPVKV